MKIAVGCDHGGLVLKNAVLEAIKDSNCSAIDFGCYTDESVDYPDFAEKVTSAIKSGEADLGVLMCGTGIGISIAANKVKGIRCAHVTDTFCAQMSKEHNNANCIALGGRICEPKAAYEMVKTFLGATFAGGRHQRRIDKITEIENKN